jgi:adenylate kinase
MHVVLFGPPGGGKGTICKKLMADGWYQLSGSDLLRDIAKDPNSKYNKEAKHSLVSGELVSDQIISGMMKEKILSLNGQPILFDGYPRTIQQAKDLQLIIGDSIKQAVFLDIPKQISINRISKRLTCKDCAASFNEDSFKSSLEKTCSYCKGELYKRPDDNIETLTKRLDIYNEKTAPLIEFYKTNKLLKIIDGTNNIEQVIKETIN